LAFITSKIAQVPGLSDLEIRDTDADFPNTGLKVSSTVRMHRLMTVNKSIIVRELGKLSPAQQASVDNRLRHLFVL
jgi:mRNA interferase MazF